MSQEDPTMMELAFNKAVQKRATERPPRKVCRDPRDVAVMVYECVGFSDHPITAPELFAKATAAGWDITREFAVKAAKWHADYLKKHEDPQ